MRNAYLTIDDIPTANTEQLIDFLVSKNIKPVMFVWGERLERHTDKAIYALKHGAVLQNHSYSHPHFGELTFDQAVEEITRNEKLINAAYKKAGIERPFKLFRFPFGDQGGENRQKLQNFLIQNNFAHLDDTSINISDYTAAGCPEDQKNNRDVLWTFDFAEYNLRPGNDFSFNDVIKRIEDKFGTAENPAYPQPEADSKAKEIVLIHDHEETEEMHPGYFMEQINALLARGVRFVPPQVQG